MSRCPVRYVECTFASQTHFSKTGITWARKTQNHAPFVALKPRLKGLYFDIKFDHIFKMTILPLAYCHAPENQARDRGTIN